MSTSSLISGARGILQLKLLWLVTSDGSRKYLLSLCFFGRASWIRYTRVISDGDAKSVARVNREQPYGIDVEIEVIYKITFVVISYLFLFY